MVMLGVVFRGGKMMENVDGSMRYGVLTCWLFGDG